MPQKYPFLLELITRLKLKSPSFFSKLQVIFGTVAGVLELATWLKGAGVNFPDVVENYINHSSAVAAGFMLLLTSLPVENKDHLETKIEQKLDDTKA